jgi:hypothetical protein
MFELIDNDAVLQIKPEKFLCPDSDIDWDKNFISTRIYIKIGGFQGEYLAEIMTFDFYKLKKDLERLYNNLNGHGYFDCLDRYLTIKIAGDGLGHFKCECEAIDRPGFEESVLKFVLSFDQTQINGLIKQLNTILEEYPIIGESNDEKLNKRSS